MLGRILRSIEIFIPSCMSFLIDRIRKSSKILETGSLTDLRNQISLYSSRTPSQKEVVSDLAYDHHVPIFGDFVDQHWFTLNDNLSV